jgi:hypothetical protein
MGARLRTIAEASACAPLATVTDTVPAAPMVNPAGGVTASRYVPGGTFAKVYTPSAPLFVVRAACAFPVNATAALGTVAPVLSVTLPRMLPVLSGLTLVGSPPPHAARPMNAAVSAIVVFMLGLQRSSSPRRSCQPIVLPCQRMRPELEPVCLARGPFPPFHVKWRAGADRRPQTASFPARVRVVDPTVEPLGVKPHRIRNA